jgi:hypothetical protein
VSLRAINWAMEAACPSPTAKLVLFVLADAHNGHSGECFPSLPRIVSTTGLSESGVKGAIRALEAVGLVVREVQKCPSGRTLGVLYHLMCEGRGRTETPRGRQETPGEGASGNPSGGRQETPGGGAQKPPYIEEPEKGTGKETGNSLSAADAATPKIIRPAPNVPVVIGPLVTARRAKGRDPPQATRLPEDFALTDNMIAFARKEGFPDASIAREFERFRDHWLQAPGARGRKSDWTAALRNWFRKAADGFGQSRHDASRGNGRADASRLGAAQRAAARFLDETHVSEQRPDLRGDGGGSVVLPLRKIG